MEIKILEQEKGKLKFELVGKSHTLANALTKELWNDKTVEVAGYNVEHPLTKNAVLIVEAKDAKKAVVDAIDRLKKDNKEFLTKFKKAAK